MGEASTFEKSADAYDRYIGRYGPELADALCAAAGVRSGQRALDVGCGPGALTAVLAERLGADHVLAADPSEPFARACRDRLPGVRVEIAPAEALPFEDACVDVALSQLVVNFMSDAPGGVRELRRVTRPGGVVASAVWDYSGEMTLLRRFWDAAVALDPAALERDEGRMPYCTVDSLGELWRGAGLEDVSVAGAVVGAAYAGYEDLWAGFEGGVGPAGAYAMALDVPGRAALRDELRGRLDAGPAPFRLTARAWVAVGRAP